jgi:TRAP-type C4-dicarboxylate transport system substrate-binding protein
MMARSVLMAAFSWLAISSTSVSAQTAERKFNVVGTWNFLTNWKDLDVPFWTQELPAASGGKLRGEIKSVTELNLKGTEILRLLKSGVYDFAAIVPIYVDDGAAIVEASDIAGVAGSFKMQREINAAWMDEMQKVMKERHNAVILGTFTYPEQNFYCRGEIASINDIKGRKVRVQGTSQADLVRAFGGSPVTISLGEVVPALEKGVVDCGITGTMSAYKAKWTEVTNTLYRMPLGFTTGLWVANLNSWNKLQPAERELMQKEFSRLQEKTWKLIEAESTEGVACTTGQGGACSVGPAGKLKLVMPSEADLKALQTALNNVVLKSWAKRCGNDCAARWNELVGKRYGLTARAD